MDQKQHKVIIPDHDSLGSIEQIADHSDISTLYRHAGKQWEGDLVSNAEREKRRLDRENQASIAIRKKFWLVGLLAPLPIALLSMLIAIFHASGNDKKVTIMILPLLALFAVWAIISYVAIRKIFEIFYKHALRAGPFLVILFALLGLSIQIIYIITLPLHTQHLMSAILLVSVIELLWSMLVSYILLVIWTTPKLNGNSKFGIILIITLLLLMAAAIVAFFFATA